MFPYSSTEKYLNVVNCVGVRKEIQHQVYFLISRGLLQVFVEIDSPFAPTAPK